MAGSNHRGLHRFDQLGAADGQLDVVEEGYNVQRLNVGRVRVIGDEASTLAVTGDANSDVHGTQLLYNTPLTGVRAVTLTVAGAVAGMTWRVTRQAGATGASGLDVGGLKTLAVSEWCEVTFDGSAWVLSSFGSL